MQNDKNTEVKRAICFGCWLQAGVLATVKDGRVTSLTGEPGHPVNQGWICERSQAFIEHLYHEDRLNYPLKRIGERGEGKWQKISWGEALDIVAEELSKAKLNHGAESVVFVHGAAKGYQEAYLRRLANTFGTPNIVSNGHVCFIPLWQSALITCGFFPIPDNNYPPSCIIAWGYNTLETSINDAESTRRALENGTKLIVIDPQDVGFANQANIWLQPKPSSDLALVLGMINVIINEGLFDKAFVNKWMVGFDKLTAHVQDYSPEIVEKICWVPAKKIAEAARLYANSKPAAIQRGNALEHNINSFQAARAIVILSAITGNLGVPGGDVGWSNLQILQRKSPELTLSNELPKSMHEKRIGTECGFIPGFSDVPNQLVIKAILEEDPYPVRAAYIQGANALLSYPNGAKSFQALNKLHFTVVSDMFMTPTAELADIILPVASFLEFDSIFAAPVSPIAQIQQKVAKIGECWPDYKILNELAKKMGLGKYFWDDERESLDFILKPYGIMFEEFKNIGHIQRVKEYRKYESSGFETPSGKVEIYSSRLKQWGFDPLFTYREPSETPLDNNGLPGEYPLILTSCKLGCFRHSAGKNISTLRGMHPDPIVKIHPTTAEELGITDGDYVYIETRQGKIRQKAMLTTKIDPRVVIVDYGWWFPEYGVSELYGWKEANINMLTDHEPPFSSEIGSNNLRGIPCKVYRCNE